LNSPDAAKYLLAACPFFATERWDCDRITEIEGDPVEFQLLVFLRGKGMLHDSASAYPYYPGQAWFLPASLELALLQPKEATSLLRVTVPDPRLLTHQLQNQGFELEAISRVVLE
jgi:mannose-6-phosphate isomerase class I